MATLEFCICGTTSLVEGGRAELSRKRFPPCHLLCRTEHVPCELFCYNRTEPEQWYHSGQIEMMILFFTWHLGCKYSARTRCLVVWFLQGWGGGGGGGGGRTGPDWAVCSLVAASSHESQSQPEPGLRQNCCTESGKHLGKTVFTYLLFYSKSW